MLAALYRVQIVDLKLTEINHLRGELPQELEELNAHLEGINKKLEQLTRQKTNLEEEISQRRHKKEELQIRLNTLRTKLDQITTTQEYTALEREIEIVELDIQLMEKESGELAQQKEETETQITQIKDDLERVSRQLSEKHKQYQDMLAHTAEDEQKLNALREKYVEAVHQLDQRLMPVYERIRRTYKNGVAVAAIERDACNGCFLLVPPQRQLEVRQYESLIFCENCGRLFIGPELAATVQQEVEAEIKKLNLKTLTT